MHRAMPSVMMSHMQLAFQLGLFTAQLGHVAEHLLALPADSTWPQAGVFVNHLICRDHGRKAPQDYLGACGNDVSI